MGTCAFYRASGREANPGPYPATCLCDKGKKSTPEFKTYVPNSGVASILLSMRACYTDVKSIFENIATFSRHAPFRRNLFHSDILESAA
jgi:hypothetical protein